MLFPPLTNYPHWGYGNRGVCPKGEYGLPWSTRVLLVTGTCIRHEKWQ